MKQLLVLVFALLATTAFASQQFFPASTLSLSSLLEDSEDSNGPTIIRFSNINEGFDSDDSDDSNANTATFPATPLVEENNNNNNNDNDNQQEPEQQDQEQDQDSEATLTIAVPMMMTTSNTEEIVPQFPFFAPSIFSSLARRFLFPDDSDFNSESESESDSDSDSSQDGSTIVRFTVTSSDDSDGNESSQTVTSTGVQSSGDDDSHSSPAADRFSAAFRRIASMIEDMRTMAMPHMMFSQADSSTSPSRGGCFLQRVCADEIDQYCSTERLSQMAGAIAMCLKQHRSDLSEDCGSAVDQRTGAASPSASDNDDGAVVVVIGDANGDADDTSAQEQEPQMPELPEVPELPSTERDTPADSDAVELPPTSTETQQPEATQQPERPCVADVAKMCSDSSSEHNHLVNVMACLHRHQSELSSECLAVLDPTPAFHCAEDAESLCPGVRGRHQIARCLHQHATQVSDECKQAAHRHSKKNAANDVNVDTTTSPQSIRFTTMNAAGSEETNPANKPSPVTDAAAAAPAAVSSSSSSSSSASDAANMPSHVLPLALAGGGFVLVVSLVAVVVAYRRRARSQEQPIIVSLGNPTQAAVDLSVEPMHYSPRPQERL